MIYEKSSAAFQEIAGYQRALSARQRQVLIMIDGKRTMNDLAKYLHNMDVPQIITDLEKLGFIHSPQAASAAPLPLPAMQAPQNSIQNSPAPQTEPHLPLTEDLLASIKNVLLVSADEYLGIMGRPIKQKIEAAQTHDQLKGCVSQWHMAIRESKLGRPVAAVLMEEVQQLLVA